MARRARGDRRHLSIRMDAGLLEALDETADEVMVSRSRLIELAVESYLQRVELPPRVVTGHEANAPLL